MYQFVNALLEPYTLLLLALFGVLLLLKRNDQPGCRLQRISLALTGLLILLSMPAVKHLAVGSLEWPYPPGVETPTGADAIVVLAGNVNFDDRAGTKLQLGDETLYRCWHALQLYRRAGSCRIIVAGGRVPGVIAEQTLAEMMRDFFVTIGVPITDVVLEEQSTTTYENARNTAKLMPTLGSERVFLVTSATHMHRAERCFTRQNMKVVPCPCNYNASRLDSLPFAIIPTSSGIRGVETAAHEWLGLLWYWLRDRI